MEGVFVLTDGTVIGRIPNTVHGCLVGLPRKGEVVQVDTRPPLKVVRVRWFFNEFESRVEIVLGPIE